MGASFGRESAILLLALATASCGEPFREQAQQYMAAISATESPGDSTQTRSKLFWNDCGRELTCLNLYETSDDATIEKAVAALLRAKRSIPHPGVKLTVLSSAHGERPVVVREVTIK
jgi:hypothetical protein